MPTKIHEWQSWKSQIETCQSIHVCDYLLCLNTASVCFWTDEQKRGRGYFTWRVFQCAEHAPGGRIAYGVKEAWGMQEEALVRGRLQ